MVPLVPTASVSLDPLPDETVLLRVTYRGRLHEVARLHPETAQRVYQAQTDGVAVPLLLRRPPVTLYWYRGRVYADAHGLLVEEAEAILSHRHRQREVERTRALNLARAGPNPVTRYVTAATRAEVFARDGGACTACGSTIDLEYDHCIPVAAGGSNEVGNIRLLCLRCNRSSGARMAL